MKIPKILERIAKNLEKKDIKAVIVGGVVRDYFLGIKDSKDIDIEVYNIDSLNELEDELKAFGAVNLVGKVFGIIKLTTSEGEFDFSLPRIEKKVAKGHKGFEVTTKKDLTFKEAAKRRDFTINAMGYDILEQKFLDPFDGKKDVEAKRLHIVDEKSFVEDPLRVYRAIQFAARFEMQLSKETFTLCKTMVARGDLKELPKERIWEEFKKLLLKAKKPSIGLKLMRDLGVLDYFLELKALIGVQQEPSYHAEGDVWTHTLMVVDEMAKLRSGDERIDIIRMLSALCHDFGKVTTTKVIDGKIRAFNHDKEGVEPTINFLKRLTNDKKLIESVSNFVLYHLRIGQLYKNRAKSAAIRRLATKISIKELELLARADYFGRISKDKKEHFEAGEWILQRAKELNVLTTPPKALILGRDLIALGLKPSAEFKTILEKAYQAQLDGAFQTKEEGLNWLKEQAFLKN